MLQCLISVVVDCHQVGAVVVVRNRLYFKAETSSWSHFEVTLWKESVDGLWACISDVNKGQGGVSAAAEGQQNEQ